MHQKPPNFKIHTPLFTSKHLYVKHLHDILTIKAFVLWWSYTWWILLFCESASLSKIGSKINLNSIRDPSTLKISCLLPLLLIMFYGLDYFYKTNLLYHKYPRLVNEVARKHALVIKINNKPHLDDIPELFDSYI